MIYKLFAFIIILGIFGGQANAKVDATGNPIVIKTITLKNPAIDNGRANIVFSEEFDINKTFTIIYYFHGNSPSNPIANIKNITKANKGDNFVVVAADLGDTPGAYEGNFAAKNVFNKFLNEMSERLAIAYGDKSKTQRFAEADKIFEAYSGGFKPLAAGIRMLDKNVKVKCIVLVDALYGQLDTYVKWIKTNPNSYFVNLYIENGSTASGNYNLVRSFNGRIPKNVTIVQTKTGHYALPGSKVLAEVHRKLL